MAGYLAGIEAHPTVRRAELVPRNPRDPVRLPNPQWEMRFSFDADSAAEAERLVREDIREAAGAAAQAATGDDARIGWVGSVGYEPA